MVDIEGELTHRVSSLIADLVLELLKIDDLQDRRVLALASISTISEAVVLPLEREP